MSKPSWKIRRRYVFGAFALGTLMVAFAIAGIWGEKIGSGDLITGGVALISATLTGYVFGAVWEDRASVSKSDEENLDG